MTKWDDGQRRVWRLTVLRTTHETVDIEAPTREQAERLAWDGPLDEVCDEIDAVNQIAGDPPPYWADWAACTRADGATVRLATARWDGYQRFDDDPSGQWWSDGSALVRLSWVDEEADRGDIDTTTMRSTWQKAETMIALSGAPVANVEPVQSEDATYRDAVRFVAADGLRVIVSRNYRPLLEGLACEVGCQIAAKPGGNGLGHSDVIPLLIGRSLETGEVLAVVAGMLEP